MNLLSKKTFNISSFFLHKIQLARFGRNIKIKSFNISEINDPISGTTSQNLKDFQNNKANEFNINQEQHKRDYTQRLDRKEELNEEKLLQLEILRTQTLESVLEIYKTKGKEMTLINRCTFLNQALNIGLKKEKKSKKELNNQPEIKEIIEVLKLSIDQMGSFSVANFLSNLARLEILDRDLLDRIIKRTIKDNIQYNEKSLAFITRAVAKVNIKNTQFLDIVAKRITNPTSPFKAKNLTFIFWSMSELEYKNKNVAEMMSKEIIENHERFDLVDIPNLFSAYNNYRDPNWDVLDKLSQHIVRDMKKLSTRTLANITTYCANLDYTNPTLFDHLEREFVKRLRNTKEIQNILSSPDEFSFLTLEKEHNEEEEESELLNNEDPFKLKFQEKELEGSENGAENFNLIDITQILVSFSKLKIVKSELFELMELIFIKNLDKASPGNMVSYAFAHSGLCNEMYQKYQENKAIFLKRSVKNLKKYNHTFYEVLIPFLQLKTPEFAIDEVFSVLVSASRPLLTKRALRRGMVDFGIMNIPKLEDLRKKYSALEFEKFTYKYNLMLQKYVDRKEQLIMISQAFADVNINIGLIDKAYTHILADDKQSGISWQEKEETFFEEEDEDSEDNQEEAKPIEAGKGQ